MDDSAVLRHLQLITADFHADGASVASAFTAFEHDLSTAVPSFAGLAITAYSHDFPVVLTAIDDPGSAVTSLRLILAAARCAPASVAQTVIYASRRGVLVDLAADLAHALAGTGQVDLDLDLPPAARANGISGLDELSAVNRAAGVLLDRGHQLGEVYRSLRSEAEAAGVAPHLWARRLLED